MRSSDSYAARRSCCPEPPSEALRSVFQECLRQMGGSEDIRHSFEVVGHHCKTQFDASSRPDVGDGGYGT